MEPPHNTTQASIVVSTLHPTEETTSSSDNYLARKPHSCSMPAVTVASVNIAYGAHRSVSPNKSSYSRATTCIAEWNPESREFCGSSLGFVFRHHVDQGLEKYYRRAWISVLRLSGKYLVYHIKPLISQLVIRYSEVHVVGTKYIALYS